MEYGASDFLRGLMRVWDSTASEDDETAVDFFLLSIMRDKGADGVVDLIQGLKLSEKGQVEIAKNGAEVVITMTRSGFKPLVLKAADDEISPWVGVRLESDSTLIAVEDPRHAAFYSIWERIVNNDHNYAELESVEERSVYLMALLESEVNNGGIGQYLANNEGLYLAETFSCLAKIGATKTHSLLTAAIALASEFDSYVDAWDEKSESYSCLDSEFLNSGEDLAALTVEVF